MESESIVERAAKAAYQKHPLMRLDYVSGTNGYVRFEPIAWTALSGHQKAIILDAQRAAIAAMREPTKEMCAEGDLVGEGKAIDEGYFGMDGGKLVYQAMIAAALK